SRDVAVSPRLALGAAGAAIGGAVRHQHTVRQALAWRWGEPMAPRRTSVFWLGAWPRHPPGDAMGVRLGIGRGAIAPRRSAVARAGRAQPRRRRAGLADARPRHD